MAFLLFARRWCVSRSGILQIGQRSNGGPFVALLLLRYRTRYQRYQEFEWLVSTTSVTKKASSQKVFIVHSLGALRGKDVSQ